jgi:cation transport ATPase
MCGSGVSTRHWPRLTLPASAFADVGVAMGPGTDVARESADVVLLGNDLLKFGEGLKIARRCWRIILTNFAGTLFGSSSLLLQRTDIGIS